jgi:hypothetical protein
MSKVSAHHCNICLRLILWPFGLLTQLLNSVSDSVIQRGKQGLCMQIVWASGFMSFYQIHTCFCQVNQAPSLKFLTFENYKQSFCEPESGCQYRYGCHFGDSNLNKVDMSIDTM